MTAPGVDPSSGAQVSSLQLRDVVIRESELIDVRVVGSVLTRVQIDGVIDGLVVNGVDVTAHVEAELDRRHPERVLLRGESVEELGDGWDWLRTAWCETHERIRRLDHEQLHARVDGEWSALETLRHLVFVHDAWFCGAIRGTLRWHALGLAAMGLTEAHDLGLDPDAVPSLEDVMNVRHQQLDEVERFLGTAGAELLASPASPPPWAQGRPCTVLDALHVLLGEEWEHRRICERDLAALLESGVSPVTSRA